MFSSLNRGVSLTPFFHGEPSVDIDADHDHGQGSPHAHNWERDDKGSPVRGPGNPVSKWPR